MNNSFATTSHVANTQRSNTLFTVDKDNKHNDDNNLRAMSP